MLPAAAVLLSLLRGTGACKKQEAGMNALMSGASCPMPCMRTLAWTRTLLGRFCFTPAVDTPAVRLSREDFDAMRAVPNIGLTAKLPSVLPVWVGMEMILSESLLPPKYVRGTACEVVGLEPPPREPPIEGRDSITTEGCVVLHYMPKCMCVRIPGSSDSFLQAGTTGAAQPSAMDLTGVLAIKPQARSWSFMPATSKTSVKNFANAGAAASQEAMHLARSAREDC